MSAERSAQMALVRNRDTKPEIRVRSALHKAGLRFRLHDKRLPGKPDIVFRSLKTVVFVHGCFWHRHPSSSCKLARLPKSRIDFWLPKLQGNFERDKLKQAALRALGWRVLVIWECEVGETRNLIALAKMIKSNRDASRTSKSIAPTHPKEVFGALKSRGKPKTLAEMKAGIPAEAKRRHARHRY